MTISSSGPGVDTSVRRKTIFRRAVVGIPLLGGLVALGGVVFPFFALGSSLRDVSLKDAVGQSGWSVQSSSATGGWFEPVIFLMCV